MEMVSPPPWVLQVWLGAAQYLQGPNLTQQTPLFPPSGASVQPTIPRVMHDCAGKVAGVSHGEGGLRDNPGWDQDPPSGPPQCSLHFYPCLLLPFSLPLLPAPGVQGLQIARARAGAARRGQGFPGSVVAGERELRTLVAPATHPVLIAHLSVPH